MSPRWLEDAVLHEICPPSSADGDGIGDLPGALAHLDHLVDLGVDTVWCNPCFASPFRDAGTTLGLPPHWPLRSTGRAVR